MLPVLTKRLRVFLPLLTAQANMRQNIEELHDELAKGQPMDGLKLSPYLAAIGMAALAAYGCGSPVKSEKSLTPPFTIPSGTWVDPTNPEEGEEPSEVAGFFLKVKSDTAEVTVHRADTAYGGNPGTTNFSTECRIPVGTSVPADKDILCIAEIEELDAFFSELNIQYHFPPSMCTYAKFMPYHFYAYEPGEGETTLSLELDENGAVLDAQPPTAFDGPAPSCVYDYSGGSGSGPNCCLGSYTLTTLQHHGTDPDTTTITSADWGGKIGSCLSGPGTSTSYSKYIAANGIPMTMVKYVEGEGLNETFKVLAPINSSFGGYYLNSNVWTANFYRVADHSAQSPAVLPADRPLALRYPATLVSETYLPSDTYRFECHNRAEEIQYRIRLMIREWNTDPISQGGNPDVNVGNDPDFPDGPINDRRDWFDMGNAYPDALF